MQTGVWPLECVSLTKRAETQRAQICGVEIVSWREKTQTHFTFPERRQTTRMSHSVAETREHEGHLNTVPLSFLQEQLGARSAAKLGFYCSLRGRFLK